MISRLQTRLRTIAQTQVQNPLDDAIELGAKLFSYDPITFLTDVHAIKSRHMARPDHMFEVVVEHLARIASCFVWNIHLKIACI